MKRATKKPTQKPSTKHTALALADHAASEAMSAVDDSAGTQIKALTALHALAAACAKDGVLVREVRRLSDERAASFTAFQLERAARATDRVTLFGEGERLVAIDVVSDALRLVEHVDAHGGDARTLSARLASLKRGGAGKPVPFFARYLAHQRR